jgi:predicted acylesterase/phospholipase RssA
MSVWGQLAERYETEKPQRKLLALDGGGIRGVITLEILARMESQLARKTAQGDSFRLGNFFDYIAGTSTGAIIAAGLAMGMSTGDLLDFYSQFGKRMFEKSFLLQRLSSFYQREPLAAKLQELFHDGQGQPATLGTAPLKCLLLVVTHNVTTDSPWPISTNPKAKYNDATRTDCNLQIPLWQLVRASTAAPVFFPPETVNWDPGDPSKTFVFQDGGITPYNNPAFLLFRMATQPTYRLNWGTGEKKLLLVSVGTGAAPNVGGSEGKNILVNLQGLPGALMYGIQVDQDVNCRTFGRCIHGSSVDREIGDLVLQETGTPEQEYGRFFRYVRYNADLSPDGLKMLGIDPNLAPAVQQMDAVDQIQNMRQVGQAVAAAEVSLGHLGSFV